MIPTPWENPTAISGSPSISHFLAVRPVLLEVSQQVADLLLILEPGVDHLGAGNLGLRIPDVLAKGRLVPRQTGVLVGIRIGISRKCAGLSADDAIQDGIDSVLRGFADLMTGFSNGEDLCARRRILCNRGCCTGQDDDTGHD